MYTEMPSTLKSAIKDLLSQDNFVEAKRLYSHWHALNNEEPRQTSASSRYTPANCSHTESLAEAETLA